MDAVCPFTSVDCAMPLAEIYDKVVFTPEETDRPSPSV